MSNTSNPFSTGGGGTNFEQYVQAAFLTTLILRGNVPCFPASEIAEIALQASSKGYKTDDICIVVKSASSEHRLLAQVKHNITFTENDLFKEVITSFWADFNNTSLFDKLNDRLVIIKSGLTENERNHIRSLFNWAKAKASETDFIAEVNRIKAKREKLQVFRDILNGINESPISDRSLWEFLKCLEVLEYDFLNEGSVDESHFLNLIKISKRNDTTVNEKEIWDGILAYTAKHNKSAGTITLASIQKDSIYSHFSVERLTPLYKSITKLRNDSSLILTPFKNTIGGIHLNRGSIVEEIYESTGSFRFTVVTGKPGTGKSAIVKEVLESRFNTDNIFSFRADQFNESHLSVMFSNQGINDSIKDLISCIALIPDKVIFIDSLEKLLEGTSESAFKQFYLLIQKYPDIKIVATSRKYAIDLLIQKFGISSVNTIEIATLNEPEIGVLKREVPSLASLFANKNLVSILNTPKYLDLTIYSLGKVIEDFSSLSITEFKNKLWSNIIEDITTVKGGMSRKRGLAFSNIAIKRAKKMKLFVEPDNNIDDEALEELVKDDVIFKDGNNHFYAPSHDILEDWALIKYIEATRDECDRPEQLFERIGTEPAIRRAFRLWVEDYLIDNKDKIVDLVRLTLTTDTVDKYWTDELLIAIFKSDNCSHFFSAFEVDLLNNNAFFLNRCLLLIRTACKENFLNTGLLIPKGSGWIEGIKFISLHIGKIDNLRFSVLNFLSDWEYLIVLTKEVKDDDLTSLKSIVLHYISQIESENEFWYKDNASKRFGDVIDLLYNIANIAVKEIEILLKKAVNKKEEATRWRRNSFYDKVIKYALSGTHLGNMAKVMPSTIMEFALKVWKKAPEKSKTSRLGIPYHRNRDECWGISNDNDFFPSGIFKTPVYQLLNSAPFATVKFITEFINYSIQTFVETDHEYKKEFKEVTVTLNDGSTITKIGNWELWVAYRGLSVTHYLLECLLMSLEKYLLELAGTKTEESRKNLKLLFDYLLRNSNSVAILAVLDSIMLAYPEELEEDFLPLLTVKEFYEWESNRGIHESQSLAIADEKIPFAQKERIRSNQLPHRTRHYQGLCDFIIEFQSLRTPLNIRIHEIFDKLFKEADKKDVLWLKKLNEIDFRKWEIVEVNQEKNAVKIQPKYEGEVKQFIDSVKDEKDLRETSASHSVWISSTYKEGPKLEMQFDRWNEIYAYYEKLDNFDYILDRPVLLAIIGLRDFGKNLNEEQKEWSINCITDALISIIQSTFRMDYMSLPRVNIMDKEPVITSIHLLLNHKEESTEIDYYVELIVYMLLAPFADHEINKITTYVRNVLFQFHPNVVPRVWYSLIITSNYRKSHPLPIRFHGDIDAAALVYDEEKAFISTTTRQQVYNLEIDKISFESHSSDSLLIAFLITPYDNEDANMTLFVNRFLSVLLSDLELETDYSHSLIRSGRQIDRRSLIEIRKYIAELFLNARVSISHQLVDIMYEAALKLSSLRPDQVRDIYEFLNSSFEYTIYKLEEDSVNKNVPKLNVHISNFWNTWEYLWFKEESSTQKLFSNVLLLNTELSWNDKYYHWLPLENKQDFYYKMIASIGDKSIRSMLIVFSTIGDQVFLPKGISALTSLLKLNSAQTFQLMTTSGERLINRIFQKHMIVVKKDKALLNDFLYILNLMIDMGSSTSYFIRENVITYKNRS